MGIERIAETYREFKSYIQVVMEEYAKFKASDAYKKVEKPEMTDEERANIEKLVSRWDLPEDTKQALVNHFFKSLNALKAKLYEEQTIKTIKEALEATVGDRVILTGVVKSIGTNTTIADEEGNTITVYKLGTTVALGDTIVVTGVIAVNSGERIVAEGATAVIKEAHGDNHKYESGKCILCGKEEPQAGEKTVKIDLNGIVGEKNVDETYKFDDVVLTTNGAGCHINNELIINTKKTAYAIIEVNGVLTQVTGSVQGKFLDATIEVSVDGNTWVKLQTVAPTNDSYTAFSKNLDATLGYKFVKISSLIGGVHVKDITVTVVA